MRSTPTLCWKASTYSILEEDEERDVWRIDAFPTEPDEAERLRETLTAHAGLKRSA